MCVYIYMWGFGCGVQSLGLGSRVYGFSYLGVHRYTGVYKHILA